VLAYFDGYQPVEPVQLTKRNATGLFKQQLAGRYGSAFTGASQFWVKCPSQEFFTDGFNDDGYQSALCTAQFESHGRWRLVSASINQTDDGPVMAKPFTRTWTRRWTREGAKCASAAGVKGRISSNYGACESLMIGDLRYSVARHERIRYAYEHGTNTAGFEEVMRYRCKQHGRTITCTNKLGDAFRWIR
jgi:hypothetical protein